MSESSALLPRWRIRGREPSLDDSEHARRLAELNALLSELSCPTPQNDARSEPPIRPEKA